MEGGERCCPNKNASLSDKLALISSEKSDSKNKTDTKPHQIAALTVEEDTDEQDAMALAELQEDEKEAVGWMVEEYLSGLSDVDYPTTSDELNQVEINSIQLIADTSYPRRVGVPLKLRDAAVCIPTMAFFDI